jgi:putative transposase
LTGFDYGSNGAYFITICTKDRERAFGTIQLLNERYEMHASEIGKIAFDYWMKIPEHFPFVIPDEFQLMPDHLHGIIIIHKSVETQDIASQNQPSANETFQNIPSQCFDREMQDIDKETQYLASLRYKNKFGPQSGNLSSIIRGYKSAVKTYAIKNAINFAWQSRFHDRIIRDQKELEATRIYIRNNPDCWIVNNQNP